MCEGVGIKEEGGGGGLLHDVVSRSTIVVAFWFGWLPCCRLGVHASALIQQRRGAPGHRAGGHVRGHVRLPAHWPRAQLGPTAAPRTLSCTQQPRAHCPAHPRTLSCTQGEALSLLCHSCTMSCHGMPTGGVRQRWRVRHAGKANTVTLTLLLLWHGSCAMIVVK